jgi:hypothetical protein
MYIQTRTGNISSVRSVPLDELEGVLVVEDASSSLLGRQLDDLRDDRRDVARPGEDPDQAALVVGDGELTERAGAPPR